jgi:hypothetical protein
MLDQFGICPFADPGRARVETAPVYCRHSAEENAVTLRFVLSVAETLGRRRDQGLGIRDQLGGAA